MILVLVPLLCIAEQACVMLITNIYCTLIHYKHLDLIGYMNFICTFSYVLYEVTNTINYF